MTREDLRRDGNCSEACWRAFADSVDLRRVVTQGRTDVLAICRCGEVTIIPWSSERWAT